MLPDGISRDSRGGFWVAAFGPRSALLDLVHPYPRLKQLLSLLPRSLLPKPKQYGLVVRLDGSGLITESLHDPSGSVVGQVTSVVERDGVLYLGNLAENYIAAVSLH